VTLAPEGAQHSWKSDLQIPNLITWEPAFAVEMEWILCDAIARHVRHDCAGRSGVLVRAVTRALSQDLLLTWLRRQAAGKLDLPAGAELGLSPADGGLRESEVPHRADAELLARVKAHALQGGYFLIDWRGYRGYQPGENVVHLFVMGALVPEAVRASEMLLERGVHANVIVVTSPDLLCGELARKTGYAHLVQTLGIDGALHLRAAGGGDGALGRGDAIDLAGRRVPVVSVHDGEIGLLDNLGSVLGVRQVARAVVRFSKSGTPADIYRYHGLHPEGIVDACGQALAETALERARLQPAAFAQLQATQLQATQLQSGPPDAPQQWRELWPDPV
jgi:pyruvate dehydrogenase E1 component